MDANDSVRQHAEFLVKDVYSSFQKSPMDEKEIQTATISVVQNTPEYGGDHKTNSLNSEKIEGIFNLQFL